MTSLNLFPVAEVQSEVRDLRLHRNTSVRYIRLFISVHYMSLTVQLEKKLYSYKSHNPNRLPSFILKAHSPFSASTRG